MNKGSLLASACAFAVVTTFVAPACAQTAGAAPDVSTLGEIVVTAQRRSELQRDVPIAITAVTPEQMQAADIKQLADITKVTPALRFDYAGAFAQPTIRGVGTAITTPGGGSNVGIYLDGFYSPNPLAANFELLNVQGIQVLKGPQGTLFGRNTTGGAILVTTADPSHDAHGVVQARFANFNTQRYQAYATTGVTEDLAVDIEGLFTRGDSFVHNIVTGDRDPGEYQNWSVRAGAKYEPTDTMSFLLRYQYMKTSDPAQVLGNAFVSNGQPLSMGTIVPGAVIATDPDEVANTQPLWFHSFSNIWQLTSTFDLGFASLTSYTQYRMDKSESSLDLDWSSAPIFYDVIPVKDKTFTQEFLLNSQGEGRLKWTAGFFFFDYKDDYQDTQVSIGGAPLVTYARSGVDTRSYAGYADITYQILPKLFLTAGGRVSHDQIKNSFFTNELFPPLGNFPLADQSSTRFTPRLVARYTPDDKSSLYASFSQGYKAPITNVGCGCLENVFVAAEKITSYEVGYKYGHGPLQASLSAYYYDYKNLQVSTYNGAFALITNAATSRVYGLEGEARYRVMQGFDLNAGFAYTDAKFKDYPNSPAFAQCLDLAACGAGFGQFLTSAIDASGFHMPRAPEFTANLSARYATDLAGGKLALSGNVYYSSKFYFDASNQFPQEGYALLSLRAEWTDPSERYTAAVFGDNLTDKRYRVQTLSGGFGVGSVWNYPTTYGVSLQARF